MMRSFFAAVNSGPIALFYAKSQVREQRDHTTPCHSSLRSNSGG